MIYIHIPFCRSFCTYCDFYSEVAPVCRNASERGGRHPFVFECYCQRICREIQDRAVEIRASRRVNTLYFGGGTPSMLPLDIFSKIVEELRDVISGSGGSGSGSVFKEFTVEVNPEDIVEKGEEYVRGLLEMGVNRVSMGVQSFDDGILRWMNRPHSAAVAREAFGILRSAGVKNICIDLIFGLSQLSDSQWKDTITEALGLPGCDSFSHGPEHISAYQLSIEEGSALAQLVAKGEYTEASDEQCRRQYDILCRRLGEAGYHHYEISNFARPGFEAVHNSAYWTRAPFVGLGAGAHSLTTDRVRSWNSASINDFSTHHEVLTDEDIRVEAIMLGLRTDKGIDSAILGGAGAFSSEQVDRLIEEGALERIVMPDGRSRIRIPEDHFFVSDEIIRELI